jgi:diguanylate cyclase (GGDEF)-like protein
MLPPAKTNVTRFERRARSTGRQTPDPGALFRRFAALAAALVMGIALLVLIGWTFGIERLMTILPGFIRMKSSTAVGLLAASLAVLAEYAGVRLLVRRLLAAVPFALGLATSFQYLTGLSLHIDQFFFLDPVQKVFPGRMAPIAAVNFVLLGLALLLRMKLRSPKRASAALAVVVTTFSMLAMVGYLYGSHLLYGSGQYTAMAIHTGISFMLLSLAVLFVDPQSAAASLIWSSGPGGLVARRLLPLAIVIPILLGGLFVSPLFTFTELRMGMAFQALTFALLFVAVIVHLCLSLNAASQATHDAEQTLMFDGLTGIYNRRYFDSRLAEEMGRSKKSGAPLSLVFFDADHFKKINDLKGHLAGDEVLKAIASLATMTLRNDDAVCRYGGEEFALILPRTSLEEAEGIADRLRTVVGGFSAEATGIGVTVSIGATMFSQRDQDGSDMVARADEALYEAKASGRNCVRVRRPGPRAARPALAPAAA